MTALWQRQTYIECEMVCYLQCPIWVWKCLNQGTCIIKYMYSKAHLQKFGFISFKIRWCIKWFIMTLYMYHNLLESGPHFIQRYIPVNPLVLYCSRLYPPHVLYASKPCTYMCMYAECLSNVNICFLCRRWFCNQINGVRGWGMLHIFCVALFFNGPL